MNKWILAIVIVIASFFRLYQIEFVPPHPSLDEVSIGYNAYSILRTGADEYGTKLPVLLRAYDDWRPALYVYFVVPFIKIFGLSVFSVRLPSVILSIVSVVALYLLVKELFLKLGKNKREKIALFAALLLAISPWHIYISRLGHEANAGFCFFVLGLLFFLRFVNYVTSKQKSFRQNASLIFSSVFLALSFDAYQSEKIIIPIIIVCLAFLYRNELLLKKKILILSCFLGLLIILPVVLQSLNPNALIRFKQTSIFTPVPDLEVVRSKNLLESISKNDYPGIIINNQKLFYTNLFVKSYFSHFQPSWLFVGKINEGFKAPGFGLLYLFELPLLVIGIWKLVKTKDVVRKHKITLAVWFFVSILPGALTTQAPHAMRIFTLLPVPQILEAIGAYYLIIFIFSKSKRAGYISILFVMLIAVFSGYGFFKAYFYDFPAKNASQFQYGVLEALAIAQSKENRYDKVVVSNRMYLAQSYMFYLFSSKYDPVSYQLQGGTGSGRFEEKHIIGKYIFINGWSRYDEKEKDILYLNTLDENDVGVSNIANVFLPSGEKVIKISEKIK